MASGVFSLRVYALIEHRRKCPTVDFVRECRSFLSDHPIFTSPNIYTEDTEKQVERILQAWTSVYDTPLLQKELFYEIVGKNPVLAARLYGTLEGHKEEDIMEFARRNLMANARIRQQVLRGLQLECKAHSQIAPPLPPRTSENCIPSSIYLQQTASQTWFEAVKLLLLELSFRKRTRVQALLFWLRSVCCI